MPALDAPPREVNAPRATFSPLQFGADAVDSRHPWRLADIVIRRLGFLLELFDMARPSEIARLQKRLTNAYEVLAPLLPDEGRHISRWKLRLNVSPEEL